MAKAMKKSITKSLHSVRGLGKWEYSVQAGKRSRLKARKKKSSKGKSLLSAKEPTSSSGESAAVHFVQSDLASFSDGASESDNDPIFLFVFVLSGKESQGIFYRGLFFRRLYCGFSHFVFRGEIFG